jgi:hypothetical protein
MEWPRCVLIGLAVMAIALDVAAGSSDSAARAARRRWALAKMDEMANEVRRCQTRFQKKREIEVCETEFNRKLRQYNEIYIEASRE